MLQISRYLERQVMDAVLMGRDFVAPKVLYMALFHGEPTIDGRGTEFAGNDYSRVLVEFAGPDEEREYHNKGSVVFPIALPSAWGELTHAALFDSRTKGNMLLWGPMGQPKQIEAGDQFFFGVGDIVVKQKKD